MLPNLSPSWVIHAAGKQTSAGAIAVVSPSSVGILSITRSAMGRYDIALSDPLDPLISLMMVVTPFVAGGSFPFPIAALDTDTNRRLEILDNTLADIDALFNIIVFRFGGF